MRSRERLIEVLESVPDERTFDQCMLRDAARMLNGKLMWAPFLIERLRNVARISISPHYRSLAADALNYLEPRP